MAPPNQKVKQLRDMLHQIIKSLPYEDLQFSGEEHPCSRTLRRVGTQSFQTRGPISRVDALQRGLQCEANWTMICNHTGDKASAKETRMLSQTPHVPSPTAWRST
eukprot:2369680-Amphidinium_carterae.2